MYLTPNVGPLFTQMGIMDEYLAKSKCCSTIRLFNEHREQDFVLDFSLTHELYVCSFFSAPLVYILLGLQD